MLHKRIDESEICCQCGVLVLTSTSLRCVICAWDRLHINFPIFFWHLSHPPAFYFMLKLPRTFRTRKANFPCQYFNKSEVNHKHRMTASYKNVEHFDKERICFRSSSIQNCKWWENSITRTSQTLEGLFFVREKTNLKLTLRSVLRSVVDF